MALKNAKELTEEALDKVAGGVFYTNVYEGTTGKIYKLGLTRDSLNYTFAKADKDKIQAIIDANTVNGRSQEGDDEAIMNALVRSGYLNHIPGTPEWVLTD